MAHVKTDRSDDSIDVLRDLVVDVGFKRYMHFLEAWGLAQQSKLGSQLFKPSVLVLEFSPIITVCEGNFE
jgi:hypothetical protein